MRFRIIVVVMRCKSWIRAALMMIIEYELYLLPFRIAQNRIRREYFSTLKPLVAAPFVTVYAVGFYRLAGYGLHMFLFVAHYAITLLTLSCEARFTITDRASGPLRGRHPIAAR